MITSIETDPLSLERLGTLAGADWDRILLHTTDEPSQSREGVKWQGILEVETRSGLHYFIGSEEEAAGNENPHLEDFRIVCGLGLEEPPAEDTIARYSSAGGLFSG